jgi:hypothetical protein
VGGCSFILAPTEQTFRAKIFYPLWMIPKAQGWSPTITAPCRALWGILLTKGSRVGSC